MIIWLLFSIIALFLAYLSKPNISSYYQIFQMLLIIWIAWFVSFGGGAMQDQYISTEHVLLALISVQSPAQKLLLKYKVDYGEVYKLLTH